MSLPEGKKCLYDGLCARVEIEEMESQHNLAAKQYTWRTEPSAVPTLETNKLFPFHYTGWQVVIMLS